MQSTSIEFMDVNNLSSNNSNNFCVGKVLNINETGQAMVDYPGNLLGSIEARTIVNFQPTIDKKGEMDIPVLLVFENEDPSLPIIVGIIRSKVYPASFIDEIILASEQQPDVVTDGKKMVLDAKEEIILNCGKSSVTLRKDGRIVVKGTQIISRASKTNKIKGSEVKIN